MDRIPTLIATDNPRDYTCGIKLTLDYLRERKKQLKNLYNLNNVELSPKIFMNMISDLINSAEEHFKKRGYL
jgi:hypothetical protein